MLESDAVAAEVDVVVNVTGDAESDVDGGVAEDQVSYE